jgi:flagellar motor switch protein FliG
MNTHKSTTYDLIMESESEDKNRTLLETVIYALFTLSAIVSIWQFVVQPIAVPSRTADFASNQTTQCVQREI